MSEAYPYDLLRRAKEIIEESYPRGRGPREDWLKDYKKLPGAALSKKAVRVLRDPHRLMRDNGTSGIIEKLLKDGYLMEVSQVRGPGRIFKVIRRTTKGTAALRLRKDVT